MTGVGHVRRLVDEVWRLRRQGRTTAALRKAQEALRLARQEKEPETLVMALRAVAQIWTDVARIDDATPPLEEAVALCRQLGHEPLLAHTLRHLADVLGASDAPASRARGLELAREALALTRSAGVEGLELANTVRALAVLEEQVRPGARDAAPLWAEARTLYAASGVDAGVEECAEALARIEGGGT